jgi:hypothetical protein
VLSGSGKLAAQLQAHRRTRECAGNVTPPGSRTVASGELASMAAITEWFSVVLSASGSRQGVSMSSIKVPRQSH